MKCVPISSTESTDGKGVSRSHKFFLNLRVFHQPHCWWINAEIIHFGFLQNSSLVTCIAHSSRKIKILESDLYWKRLEGSCNVNLKEKE